MFSVDSLSSYTDVGVYVHFTTKAMAWSPITSNSLNFKDIIIPINTEVFF